MLRNEINEKLPALIYSLIIKSISYEIKYKKLDNLLNFSERLKSVDDRGLRKLVAETYKEIMAEKGKYDDGDGKDEKCDHIDCEGEDKKEKVDEKYDDDVVDAQTLAKKFKKKDKEKKKKVDEVDEDDAEVMDKVPTLEESKQKAQKEVIKEVPRQKREQPKETNKAWYNASLYNKLMSKWTKKGDK